MASICTSSYSRRVALQSLRPGVGLRTGVTRCSTVVAAAALRSASTAAAAPLQRRVKPQQQQQQQQQQWVLEEQPRLRHSGGEPVSDACAGPSSEQQQRKQQPHNKQQQQRQQQQQQQQQAHPLALASVAALFAAAGAGGVLGSGFSLEGPWSVAEALGALAAIIAVHEAGHFAAARLQGIHVTEFSIGFGPRLWSRKAEGDPVEYSLRAVPLGGYVAFPDGEDANSGFAADDSDLLNNRSLGQRAIVISAGVAANIVFALVVLLLQIGTIGKAESAYLRGVRVPEVTPGGAAERAGVRAGDVVLRVGDYEVLAAPDQVSAVVEAIRSHPNEPLELEIARGGSSGRSSKLGGSGVDAASAASETLVVPVTPVPGRDGRGAIGVSLYANTYIKHTKPDTLGGILSTTASEFARVTGAVLTGFKAIATNFAGVAGQISGPVAIVAKGSEIARTDSAGLFQFAAIVNVNLAAVNLLPLPGLDGGYLALLALEAARGRKLPAGLEAGVMAGGLLVMTALGVGLVIRDTINLF